MAKHEILEKNYHKERTTYADGTTVTVDWDAKTVQISPDLK
jgi:glutathionyl-hydroquinone reductase